MATSKQKRDHESYLRNREKVKARSKAWAAANPEKVRAIKAKSAAKNPERLQEQFRRSRRKRAGATQPTGERREGACQVCGQHQAPLCFDHDHATGDFRGWLCHGCNKILGLAHDRPARLRALAAYLERMPDTGAAFGHLDSDPIVS